MEYTHDQNCICPGCMSWDAFDNIYIDFAMEYSQQILTYTLSTESLSDFPKNMPPNLIVPIMAKRFKILNDEIKQRGYTSGSTIPDDAEDEILQLANMQLTLAQHRIRCAFEGVYAIARFGKKIPEMEFPDFQRVLISQNIVVICSFSEGFLSNAIRFLCGIYQAPMKVWEKKQGRKLENISPSEKFEKYVFELGYGSFNKKIERVASEFRIHIPVSILERKKIVKLFLIRNCIVHNAGRVSQMYKKSKMVPTGLSVGDPVDLSNEIAEDLIDTLVDVVTTVYRSVSIQILKKPKEQLFFGPHRNIQE